MKNAIGRGFGFAIGLAIARLALLAISFLLLAFLLLLVAAAAAHAQDDPSQPVIRYYCVAAQEIPNDAYFQAGSVPISGQEFPLYCEPLR